MMTRLAMTLAAASILAIGAAIPALADEVNIYTTREPPRPALP
jgi:iron(III) transport system substrate-binding protein